MADEHASPEGQARGLTVLLIAYEFPPSPSPQSLRWTYLARELALNGHRVHVLAPEHPGAGLGLPVLPSGVVIHRTFAGPAMGLLNALARRGRHSKAKAGSGNEDRGDSAVQDAAPPVPPVLNWKGHVHNAFNRWKVAVFHGMQRLTASWFFPDGRAEWYPWAKRRLRQLLKELQPDLVVSSHEPATTLSLGLIAHRMGVRWVADLGDPVLAPYTPARWKRRSWELEREVCRSASLVITTAEAAASTLRERHAISGRTQVFTQGFDGRMHDDHVHDQGDVLELLYTGSFYAFRRSSVLLDAVMKTPGVRLSIASINVPDEVVAASRQSDAIRLLGFLPHSEITRLQQRYDVLVNIANDDPCQIPGKFYEYLGAGRPILHVGSERDAAAEILRRTGRGWICAADAHAVGSTLGALRAAFDERRLTHSMDLSRDPVRDYDWREIGSRLDHAIRRVVGHQNGN